MRLRKKKLDRPSWPVIKTRPLPSGNLQFYIDVTRDGRRVYRSFTTEADAVEEAWKLSGEKDDHGNVALALTTAQRTEAAVCFEKLTGTGGTLTQAVDHYIATVLKFKDAPPVEGVVAEFLAKKSKRSQSYQIALAGRLNAFAAKFAGRQLATITRAELFTYITAGTPSPRTQRHRKTQVGMLFSHALREGYIRENPVKLIDAKELDDLVDGEIQALTPEEAHKLLLAAWDTDLLPFVAVGLFAGPRVAELRRLDWSRINLTRGTITLDASVTKRRQRRIIPTCDALRAWLAPYVRASGPVVPAENFRKKRDALLRSIGYGTPGTETKSEQVRGVKLRKWPDNAMRHSFASYRYAQTGDPKLTAQEMGHDEEMLFQHYRALTDATTAEAFFALRPATEANVVPFQAAANG